MKVLLLGHGGRESALAWALSRSRVVSELFAAPGNPGIAELATIADADHSDPAEVVDLARRLSADLVVVGPEDPLVSGVADALRADGRRVFGPDAAAARVEGSKAYAKELMARAGIATAAWRAFESVDEAVTWMDELGPPYVVKADGVAAGKGVVVTDDRALAIDAIEDRLVRGRFGDAGRRVVIEEFVSGEELSLIALCDGRTAVTCEPAQDYKRVFDGDVGPNTGGMGAYSPVPSCGAGVAARIAEEVIGPMVREVARATPDSPFVGALYAGLIFADDGPRVLEFNARFGDPETQALLPRLRSDLGELCIACAQGDLQGMELEWTPEASVCVVLASGGYPGTYQTGVPIEGVGEASSLEGVEIFHAGTAMRDGRLVTAGGRVVSVSATAEGFESARRRAYDAADRIYFEGKHRRSDIALRAVEAEGARA